MGDEGGGRRMVRGGVSSEVSIRGLGRWDCNGAVVGVERGGVRGYPAAEGELGF